MKPGLSRLGPRLGPRLPQAVTNSFYQPSSQSNHVLSYLDDIPEADDEPYLNNIFSLLLPEVSTWQNLSDLKVDKVQELKSF